MGAWPFSPAISQGMFAAKHVMMLMTESEGDDATKSSPQQPEWGVSYIGGDPCGSKYNTDPHDAQVEKPGMPDDMKARIAALADKKRESQQEQDD